MLDDLHLVSVRHPGLLIDTDRVMQDPVCAAPFDRLRSVMEAHAPLLCLHSQDLYQPADVAYYLDRMALGILDPNTDARFLQQIPVTQVTLVNLVNLLTQLRFGLSSSSPVLSPDRQTRWQLLVQGTRAPKGFTGDWQAFCEQTRCGAGASPRFYVHIRRAPDGSDALDIQYSSFYPFNGHMGGFFGAEHEADWEHVTARITTSGELTKLYFSAHDGEGQWYHLAGDGPELVGGTHPVVYSAKHSHASYPCAGRIVRRKIVGSAPDDRTDRGGTQYRTWDALELLALQQRGRAGTTGFTSLAGGEGRPDPGPGFQPSWFAEPPVASEAQGATCTADVASLSPTDGSAAIADRPARAAARRRRPAGTASPSH